MKMKWSSFLDHLLILSHMKKNDYKTKEYKSRDRSKRKKIIDSEIFSNLNLHELLKMLWSKFITKHIKTMRTETLNHRTVHDRLGKKSFSSWHNTFNISLYSKWCCPSRTVLSLLRTSFSSLQHVFDQSWSCLPLGKL